MAVRSASSLAILMRTASTILSIAALSASGCSISKEFTITNATGSDINITEITEQGSTISKIKKLSEKDITIIAGRTLDLFLYHRCTIKNSTTITINNTEYNLPKYLTEEVNHWRGCSWIWQATHSKEGNLIIIKDRNPILKHENTAVELTPTMANQSLERTAIAAVRTTSS